MSEVASVSNSYSTASNSGWRSFAEIGLVFLIFLIFGGDAAPHVNEPHYLCRFKHYWQPDWAAGDLFLESPDAHFFVVVSFGWLTKFLSLPETAWTLRVAVWLALAWAWQRLSFRLVPMAWCAPLAAAIWTMGIEQGNLAGEWVIGGFESKCVAYVFVLLALRDIVDERWNRAWILLGCASAFHVLVGGWSVIVAIFVWAMLRLGSMTGRARLLPSLNQVPNLGSAGASPSQPAFSSMLPGLAIGGLISLLGLIPVLTLNSGTPSETVAEANTIYTFIRLPHHLALFHQDWAWLLDRAGRHAVVLTIWVLLAIRFRWNALETMSSPLGRMIYFACGALAIAVCGGLIEILLWNWPLTAAKWQRFYWYRLNDVIGAAMAAWLLVDWVAELLSKRKARGILLLAGLLVVVGWRMARLSYERVTSPIAPADRKMLDAGAWVDVCEWIGEHTPRTAKFLVPKESHSFKWRTGRPEVVTRKDIPQDAASMVEWHVRLQDVFRIPKQEPALWLANPDLGRIAQLAERYEADYLVIDNRESLNLPVIYDNETYSVYDLRELR